MTAVLSLFRCPGVWLGLSCHGVTDPRERDGLIFQRTAASVDASPLFTIVPLRGATCRMEQWIQDRVRLGEDVFTLTEYNALWMS